MASAAWLLLLCGGLIACGGSGEATPPGAAPAQQGGFGRGMVPRDAPGRIAPVEVEPVRVGDIARHINVTGVVEPIRTVGVNSQMSGALREVRVQEGDTVAAGAVLAVLDDRELQAQLASAEANHEVARAAAERSELLRERQIITAAEFDRDRAALAVATAQLEQLRTRVEFATIRAPIAGVVTEKRVETGDVVGPQSRLFSLADISTMVVRVQVSELDVVELAAGDAVEVMLDAVPGRTLNGQIRRIFPGADPASRLVPVELALAARDAQLARPGFLARVRFALNVRQGVRLVPAGAVVGGVGDQAAFVVEDGRAVRRPVRTGLSSEGRVEIVDGLEPGELVIVAGGSGLRDGSEVRIVNDTAGTAAGQAPPSPPDAAGRGQRPGAGGAAS